ncbi:MAG: hypothetical protein AABX14_02045, partial [Candidatus Aenigmatarchaeota archaeon]
MTKDKIYRGRLMKITAALLVLLFVAPSLTYAAATNVSILYGWNGTDFVPVQVTSEGAIKTDINMTQTVGINPKVNNTYDLGSISRLWANLYARSIRSGGFLSIIGDANVTGTFYASGIVANLENSTGLTNVSILYGVNQSNTAQQVPLQIQDGALKLSVEQVNINTATTADSLTVGANGTDLTLTGTLTVGGVNVTGRQASDNTTLGNRIATQETKQAADNTTLTALLGQKLNLTGGTLSGSLTGTFGTFGNGLNVTAGGLIVAAGNVGIGTTGPTAALDVFKTTKQLQLSYDAVTRAQFTVAGSGILTILTDNSAAIAVTNGMTIGGNVGIGTTG